MRTRTRLTTPPGQAPALSDDARPDTETYVPGLALPEEPRVPGRHRRLWVTLALLGAAAIVGLVAFLVVTSGQTFDPALELDANPGEAVPADDTVTDPADATHDDA